jgi:hypothetical protein
MTRPNLLKFQLVACASRVVQGKWRDELVVGPSPLRNDCGATCHCITR